jgi:hypothetical protein
MQGPFPPWDETYDAQAQVKRQHDGTLNAVGTDEGYVLEWRANLAFQVAAPQFGLCQVMLNDRDDQVDGGSSKTTWTAFGQEVNNPQHWGTCTFSCAAP